MSHCPQCQSPATWLLGDGRRKCKACGARYSCRSVWDSIRLSDAAKRTLLHAFVDGRSAYRQRFDEGPCVDSRERFNRLARACCTLSEAVDESAIRIAAFRPSGARATYMRGWTGAENVLLVPLRENAGQVAVARYSLRSADSLVSLLSRRIALGGICSMEDEVAFATLRAHAGYVVIGKGCCPALGEGTLDEFWSYTKQRLQPLRRISSAFFHLYLGEMCYRFNHRSSDLAVDLHELLQSTAATDVRTLLDDGGRPAGKVRRSTSAGQASLEPLPSA